MSGDRIKNAKSALRSFIANLPPKSFFNVISFGDDYQFLFPYSRSVDDEYSVLDAITQIKNFDADLGGTEILKPIEEYIERY